ncbi:MAG: hypothetical protein KGJ88_13195 [Verrucomicrobiota bacterium]|nr:hypothetical protein [Verrucomicrobiota bacterium]
MKYQIIASLFDCLSVVAVGIFLLLARNRAVAKISDPARKEKVGRILKYAGILAIIGGLISGLTHIPTFIASPDVRAAQFARKLNESSPKQLDSVTRFDKATAGPGPRVVVDETVMLKASDLSEETWQKFLPQLKQNVMHSQMGELPAEGITLVIRYSDKDGAQIHDVEFSPLQH